MDFIYFFRILLKRKWIIIGAGILAAFVAYYFTKNERKLYKSTAQISTGFTASDEIKVNEENFNFFEGEARFNNVLVTFTSPAVTSLLSYKLILHDLTDSAAFRKLSPEQKQSDAYKQINLEEAKNTFRDKLETMTMLTSYKPDEKKLLAFLGLYGYSYNTIATNLKVYRLQRTDYIQIDYGSENPELSAYVVNNAYYQFLRYYKSLRSTKSQESIDTLRSMMEKKKQELDNKNAVLKGEGLVDVGIASTSNFDMIASLEQSLTEEKKKQTLLYYEIRKVNQRIANSKPGVTTNTGVNNNEEILLLKKEMNEAYLTWVNSGKTDKAAESKYNTLKTEYTNKVINSSSTVERPADNTSRNKLLEQKNDLEVDIEASNSTIASLQSRINSMKGNVSSTASKGAAVETLLNEVELANKEYLAAKQKYNDAIDMNTSAVNNFRPVLLGQPAIQPEPSKRVFIIGMAGVAAFIISILIILFLTYLDSSVKTPSIFSKTVDLKLISMVNFTSLKKHNLADIVANKSGAENFAEGKRQNVFRESIRKLRFEIERTGKQIFLFTSTKKGEGKTTLIQALSFSMSLNKKKILIIDTNFCNNDLTVQLDAQPILEKMDTEFTNDRDFSRQIHINSKDVGLGTVFAIGSAGGDYTPSEILPHANILQHLRSLTQEYDYIFLEGPPLNDFSDSRELANYVDGVIAIFSATQIIKQIDKESIEFFKSLNGSFIGSVLNKVDLKDVNVA